MPQEQKINSCGLQYVFPARLALDGAGYLSQLVQFNIAKFVICATRLFAELDVVHLFTPVSWCPKQHTPMCLAAAAPVASAAVIARHS